MIEMNEMMSCVLTLAGTLDAIANSHGLAVPEVLAVAFADAWIRVVLKMGHVVG